MISYSQGKKTIPAVFLCVLFPIRLAGQKLKGYFAWCGGWFKNMYCICALTWALEVMLVPLTFYFTFSFLYQIHFCICCNFSPKQVMHQSMELSEFKY